MKSSTMVTKQPEGKEKEKEIKCCVVGDGGVGKTSIMLSYTTGKMMTTYQPTCFESYLVEVQHGENIREMCVMDTAGQETYDRLRTLSYYDTDVFLVCFSVDDQDSFENVKSKWIPEIKEFRPNTPFILLGTQTDLRHSLVDITDACITSTKGKKTAKRLGAEKYMECSSLDGTGLDEVFQEAIHLALNPHKKRQTWKSIKRVFKKKTKST